MAEAQKVEGVPRFELRHRMALALEHVDMTREDMAEHLDVHRNTVGNWMKGTKPIPRAALIAWAFRCGVPFEWLLTGREDAAPDSGPGQDTHLARCIRGPWGTEPTGDLTGDGEDGVVSEEERVA